MTTPHDPETDMPVTVTPLPPLPPGWARAEECAPLLLAVEKQPPPRMPASAAPPQSGVLTTVTGVSGHPVTLHRAEYTVRSARGEFTSHGYAWRCTSAACRRVTTGYPAKGFGRAHRDAEAHDCAEVRGGR